MFAAEGGGSLSCTYDAATHSIVVEKVFQDADGDSSELISGLVGIEIDGLQNPS